MLLSEITMSNKHAGSVILTKPKIPFLEGTRAYATLRREVEEAGILKRDYTYYAIMTVCITVGLCIIIVLFASVSRIWLLIPLAVLVGVCVVQFGGLMHDAGHQAIFWSSRWNDLFGQYFAAIGTLSYDQWKPTHNKHHAHPNEEDEDPDIGLVFHAFMEKQLLRKSPILRVLSRYQAYLFYPLRSLTFISTRLNSWDYIRSHLPETRVKAIVFFAGLAFWFIVPFVAFPLGKAFIFVLVANFTGGILASNVFAPNHKGMPLVKKGAKMSFLEQQVVTARNIKPGFFTDFLYMGLNYQIEHHLFPNCPRNKLGMLTPYVKRMCRKVNISYTVDDVLTVHKDIVRKLHAVSRLA